MFSTARPPSQYQYVTVRPTISPPALHNARYAGWVRPPIQLPRAASTIDTSSRHPYEVTTTNSQSHPYATHPCTNSRTQASADTMSYVDSQHRNISHSWSWNGGLSVVICIRPNLGDKGDAYTPSLQGVSEMCTTAQHNTDNAGLIDGRSTRQTMPSNLNIQKACPHPFLAPPSAPLIYDLRYSPTSLRFLSPSPFAGCGYGSSAHTFLGRLTSAPNAGEEVVTCLDVLSTLHAALQCPLTDTEWGTAGDDKRASLIRARDRRLWIRLALHGSSNPAPRTRPTVQREPLLLRVDWLGSSVAFMGLVKDEAFARRRLVPGGRERPETWVVKFQKL
ncbi:hypothetical protein EV424DRAFT_1609467 [Suillus variegatus]|nr:hypothetical protein EV424DRAFT_1609467 [Suillus variegatus]